MPRPLHSASMTVVVGLAAVLLLSGAPRGKPRPAVPVPAAAPVIHPEKLSTSELVAMARQQYEALEYDVVAKLAEAALARSNLTLEEKLDALALQGSALAIIADPFDAEKPFRLLMRARPDFNLPDSTPPKILAVFRKVQVEEKAIVDEFATIQRQRLSATLKLSGEPPKEARGGKALRFAYRLRDPQGAVDSVRMQYRRKGEAEYLSLPLKLDDAGRWAGRIPGEWSASDEAFVLEFVVTAGDSKGVLLSLGSPSSPQSLPVEPGQVETNLRPVPAWGFLTAAGATGVVGVTAGVLAATTAWLDSDYSQRLEASSPERPADGASLARQADLATTVMVAQFVGWGLTGVGVVVSSLMAPFTNWSGEEPENDDADESTTTTETTPPNTGSRVAARAQ
jgi:hypothetical protein